MSYSLTIKDGAQGADYSDPAFDLGGNNLTNWIGPSGSERRWENDYIEPVSLWEDPIFLGLLGAGGVAWGLSAGESAVLYSGTGAPALAAASSGIPIFKTFIGGAMDKFETITGTGLPKIMWDVASAIYAATARGTVEVFITEASYNSTFYRIEAPIIEFLNKATMIFR